MPSKVVKTPQQQFIEGVRGTFLLDEDLPEHLKAGAQNLRSNLNSALRLLSEDLYSKKSHFVLELIQNADDNSYRSEAVPELTLHITPRLLVLSNNEVGFSEANITAICKVGASTKANDKHHHIGEKGIGFKSVFSVSNGPEIHSNGFHFRFDRTDSKNLLGYVVPSWCEPFSQDQTGHTTIVLPAKPDYVFDKNTTADLDARILLFLNKLQRLTLVQDGTKQVYQRTNKDAQTWLQTSTKTTSGETTEATLQYVRVTSTLPMVGKFVDDKRPDARESTVVLTLPVDSAGAARLEAASYVFAYLPIHQFGFQFPLHADFILSAGRENVLHDRPWNQRLRDGIAQTFVAALQEFKKRPSLALSYLKYIPDESDVADGFFGKVRRGIVEKLAAEESLPSSSGTWHKPSYLRMANEGFRLLFSSTDARTLFNFDYLDARVAGDPSLLDELGVEEAGCDEILEVFRSHQDWLSRQTLEWRAALYAFIADNLSAFKSAGLFKLPCLPTSDGSYVSPAKTSAFFPLGRGKKYGFEDELTIVDNEVYEAALKRSAQIKKLFETMGVRADDPYDLVVNHVIPLHAGKGWMNSERDALVGHLRYVKDKLVAILTRADAQGKTPLQVYGMLREGIWIGTKFVGDGDTWNFNRVEQLYLGKEYKPTFCIETYAGGEPGLASYVAIDYLRQDAKDPDAEAKAWREFFELLGVRTCPALEQVGNDWHSSKELGLLLKASNPKIRKETLECLNQHWTVYSSRLTYQRPVSRNKFETLDTWFARELRQTEAPLRGRKAAVALADAYYPTEELLRTLGDGLAYVEANLTARMLDACGVTHRLDAKSLVKRLKQLKQSDAGTTKQVQAIYRVLERLWDADSSFIKKSFAADGLIQLKGANKGWFSPDEVAWLNNGQFLDSLFPPVQALYRDFQGFFVDKLGVPRLLPISRRVEALTRLPEIADRVTREAEALAIYKRAEAALKPPFGRKIDVPDWISTFMYEEVFVDHWGEVVSNDDHLFANDAPEIARLFEDEASLSLVSVPPVEVPRLSRLLDAASVARLSQSISMQVEATPGGKVDKDLTSRIQRAVPFIGRVIYAREPHTFENVLDERKLVVLWNLSVVEVEAVNLRVTLCGFSRDSTADVAMSGRRMLYRTNARSLKDRVATELSRHLVGSPAFADTFARILIEDDVEAIEEFLGVTGIGDLPPDLDRAMRQRELVTEPTIEPSEDASRGSDVQEEPEEEDAGGTQDTQKYPMEPTAPVDAESQSDASTSKKSEVHSGVSASPPTSPQVSTSNSNLSTPGPDNPQASSAPETRGNEKFSRSQVPELGLRSKQQRAGTPSSETTNGQRPRQAHSTDGFDEPSTHGVGQTGNAVGNPLTGAPAPTTAPSARTSSQAPPPHTKSGRLLSYVEGPGDAGRADVEAEVEKAAARDATGKAAVAHFLKTQASRWQSLTEMPHNNPGFDVLAQTTAGVDEYIEVKGQKGAWTQEGVALTPTELLTAQKTRERYWLCVVEFAQDDKRRQLHLLRDPFGRVDQFRFDVGWKAASETVVNAPIIPQKGLYIGIAGQGVGRILSVRGKGAFFQMHVILSDGRQVNSLYHPGKMHLSKEPLWQE